jgi:hypothetical protein
MCIALTNQPICDRSAVDIRRMRVLVAYHVAFRIKLCSLQHAVYQLIILYADKVVFSGFLLLLSLAINHMSQ